ncbi:nose resistant to fluoxetine protein 6-like isoform X3 [Daphnia pulicaria]|uniref:nose resistant to fluoxetine protein 6-like isoform X3 n=1 Tax=Daphnia pulicaria TaxID=35523 RepID=UPI001EEA91D2|nr:nose resistant to fluoxetine protein 6-like isoform X3 [Daphnia pulicaria]
MFQKGESSFHFFIVPITNGLTTTPASNQEENQDLGEWWIASSVPTAASVMSTINEKCFQHSQKFLTSLRSRLPWAVKMYESSGKLVKNLIYAEGSDKVHHGSGLFDECLSVQSEGVPFQGQYCTVFFGLKLIDQEESALGHRNDTNSLNEEEPNEHISNFQKPSVSFCLPSTCTAGDLRSAVAQLVGFRVINQNNYSIVTISSDNYCYTEEKIHASRTTFDILTLAVLLIFCLFGITATTATIHHIWTENSSLQSFAVQLLHCFSAKKNCRSLLSTEQDSKDSLPCLHGIRVLTVCWIVLMHVGSEFSIERMVYNKSTAVKNSLRWEVQGLANGLFMVDTFFLISGLLVAFTQLRQLDNNNGFFNLKRFYFHRYIRLTPVYAAVLAFIATLGPYIGTGPDWHFVRRMSKGVRERWWTNMLYINNYVATTELSMSSPLMGPVECWYLACDMQMFWLSPLFIYPIWRWKKTGTIWTVASLIVFLAISARAFIVHNLPATLTPLGRPSEIARIDDYVLNHYMETFSRIPPYLIGILLGWLLHMKKNKKITIHKCQAAAGWVTATLIGLTVNFGMAPFVDETVVPVVNPFIRVSYGTLHHSAWAITIGWIIFACTHGYGGFINNFLSCKLFIPFSRLSYAVYLIHFNFIKAYASHLRKPFYFTEYVYATTYLGILVIAFVLAFVVSVVVEMPFLNLDKLLFPNNSKASKIKNS